MNRWKLPLACLALLTLAVAAPASAAEIAARDATPAEPAVTPEATPAPDTSLLPEAPTEQALFEVGESCSEDEYFTVFSTEFPCDVGCANACAAEGARLWCYDNVRVCWCVCCPE